LREMNRGQFLRLSLAGAAATAGAGVLAGPATAALPVPKPQGDDVGYLSFGAVGELTSLAWYRQALRVRGFSAGERRRLQAAATAKRAHIGRINTALGTDALSPGDFAASFPASRLASRDRAIGLGREIEDLLVGVYLNGAAFARDSATRLLLGRLLAYDAQQLAWIRGLTGGPAGAGLPSPQTLEQAGATLDGLVTTPSFTNS
jgi:ferritin-like protein